MSITKMMNPQTFNPMPGQPVQLTSFSDVVSASFEATRDNFNTSSRKDLIDAGRSNRDEVYRKRFGVSLKDQVKSNVSKRMDEFSHLPEASRSSKWDEIEQDEIDRMISKARENDPEGYRDIQTGNEILESAKTKAKSSLDKLEEFKAGATGFDSFAGGLVSGLAASFFDPLNLATMPFGAGPGRSILKAAAIEASVNAGVEIAMQPFVAKWQKEIGNEYGFIDAAENVGMAAIFGASIGGAGKFLENRLTPEQAFDAIASNKELPAALRDAARVEELRAHIKENNPDLSGRFDGHLESIQAATSKLQKGEPLTLDDIKLNDADLKGFLVEAKKMGDLTERQKETLSLLEKYVGDDVTVSSQGPATKQIQADRLKEAAANKGINDLGPSENFEFGRISRDGKSVKIESEAGEVLTAAKGSGLARKKKTDSDMVMFAKDEAGEVRAYMPISKIDAEDFRGSVTQGKPRKLSKAYKESSISELDQPIDTAKRQQEIVASFDSPEQIKAEEQAFSDLLDEFGDETIIVDGEELSVRDLADRIEDDKAFAREVQICAFGGQAS